LSNEQFKKFYRSWN